jgi:hypothetical protein
MSNALGDRAVGSIVYFKFATHKADGTPITLAGTPSLACYYDDNTTETTDGITLVVDHDSKTGSHSVKIDTSANATFYATNRAITVQIAAGTVDSISVVGVPIAHFTLDKGNVATLKSQALTVGAGVTINAYVGAGAAPGAKGGLPITDASTGLILTGYGGGAVQTAADLIKILGSALSETSAGYLSAAFKKFLDVATPLLTCAAAMRGTDNANTTAPDNTNIVAIHDLIKASAAGDVAAMKTAVDAINTIVASGTYGNASLLTAIQNVQNGSFISATIPAVLERPDTSYKTINLVFLFADETGTPKDLDSGNPTISLVNDDNTDLSDRLGSWTHPATGQYNISYDNTSTDALELLHWIVSGMVNTKVRKYVAMTQLVDITAVDFTQTDRNKLEAIDTLTKASGPGDLAAMMGVIEHIGFDDHDNILAVKNATDAVGTDFSLAEKVSLSAATPTITVSGMPVLGSDNKVLISANSQDLSSSLKVNAGALSAQETRDAMKLAPTAGAPAAGSIDKQLDDVTADVAAQITADHGAGSYQSTSAGSGSLAIVLHAQDAQGAPIMGVTMAVYDGLTGLTYQAGGITNVSGNVTVNLDAGSYSVTKTKQGSYTFTNPETMVITVAATVNFVGTALPAPAPIAGVQILRLRAVDMGGVFDPHAKITATRAAENMTISGSTITRKSEGAINLTGEYFDLLMVKGSSTIVEVISGGVRALYGTITVTSADLTTPADYSELK